MAIKIDIAVKSALQNAGVEVLWTPDTALIAENCVFEPPCSLKWMAVEYGLKMGAFSYAVSGYFFAVSMGRYCSIGEQVQMGRGDHPVDWLSTSPVQYLDQPLFGVGYQFRFAKEYHSYRPHELPAGVEPTHVKPIIVKNDVWIGHGALIKPGVTINDGAIVGAHAVVTKDVAPYTIVVGNPARPKKQRFPDEVISDLMDLKWWRFAPWQLHGTPFYNIKEAISFLRDRISRFTVYEPPLISLSELIQKRNLNQGR